METEPLDTRDNKIPDTFKETLPDKTLPGFIQTLIDSKNLPEHVHTEAQAYTIISMGKELGLKPLQALHQIIPINGRLSLSAKAIGAILRANSVAYTVLEDGVFVFSNGTFENQGEGEGKLLDRRTTLLFTRNGQKEKVSFTWRDASAMELATKSNWTKMPKAMLYARTLAKGANIVAPDLLLGLYSTDELFDSFNLEEDKVKRDEDGYIDAIID